MIMSKHNVFAMLNTYKQTLIKCTNSLFTTANLSTEVTNECDNEMCGLMEINVNLILANQ